MCIELFVDKVLVFSQCVTNVTNSTHNISHINVSMTNATNYNISNFSNTTHISNVSNTTFLYSNSSTNYTNYTSVTVVKASNKTANLTFQNVSSANTTIAFVGPIYANGANTTLANITANTSDPILMPTSHANEQASEVVLKIVIPLLLLGLIWGIVIFLRRKQRRKVHCMKIVDNPYFGKDVETPPDEALEHVEHKHQDPKKNVVQSSKTEPLL